MEFLTILLPVFGVFVLGYIGQKKLKVDPKGISSMAVYLMSPFLAFRTFYNTTFNQDYFYLMIFTFVLCLAIILMVYCISFVKKYSTRETCALILASAFMNNGNYGTPVVLLLFGAAGLDYAIVLMVGQQLVMCTVGIYYAAKGSPDGDGIHSAMRAVRRMPIVYAAIAGVFLHYFQIDIGRSVNEVVDLIGSAAIPTIMIILGMQLASVSFKKIPRMKISIALILKLVLSPIIAYALTILFPVSSMAAKIMVTVAAMPSAANTTMYALQYNTEPEFVSSATFVSTVLSLVTLPIVFFFVL
ncbi:AEC family transporter [Bacillus massiliglaciei]|uniref:AEC family transporter n=1 Tax=Bacillus massiliglaciei TaxID=1816693 RepID=UPI000B0129F5|nr:AEC family transporter [Bacillus massiliglaciei]